MCPGHVLADRRVSAALVAAPMGRLAVALMEDLNGRRGGPRPHLLAAKGVMDRVIVAVDLDVVVETFTLVLVHSAYSYGSVGSGLIAGPSSSSNKARRLCR